MIEERLGCYVLVGTRTLRVGAGGHSTGGLCWQVMTTSCNCIRVQRSLKATWRPKACFGLVDGTNVPGMPFVDGSKRLLRKEDIVPSPMFSDILGLPSVPRKWASRMLRAMHAADNPLTAK